jgi:hypothetical protein
VNINLVRVAGSSLVVETAGKLSVTNELTRIGGFPISLSGFGGNTGVQLVTVNDGFVNGHTVLEGSPGLRIIGIRDENNAALSSSQVSEAIVSVAGLRVFQMGWTGQSVIGADNTDVVITLAAAPLRRHYLGILSYFYNGANSPQILTVQDGATTIFRHSIKTSQNTSLDVPLSAGGLVGTLNSAMTITLPAAGAGTSGVLSVGTRDA